MSRSGKRGRSAGSGSPAEPPVFYKGVFFERTNTLPTAAEALEAEHADYAHSDDLAKSLRNRHLDACDVRECETLEEQEKVVHPAERTFMKLWNNFRWDRERPPLNKRPLLSRTQLFALCKEFIETHQEPLADTELRKVLLVWLLRVARYSQGKFGKKEFLACLRLLPAAERQPSSD